MEAALQISETGHLALGTLHTNSAAKAVKLGYSNVMVVPEGYPAWEKLAGAGPAIEKGKEDGSISVASFERIYKEDEGSEIMVA